MNKFSVFALLVLGTAVVAEPPSGYHIGKPIGGGLHTPDFGGSGSDGGYTAINSGYQTSEGLHVDPQLLHKIKEILLDHENLGGGGGGHGHGHGGHGGGSLISVPSSSYGIPSSSYGVPEPRQAYGVPSFGGHSSRVVGIELGHVRQGHQVAQFYKAQSAPSYHLNTFSVPSKSYGAPSHHHHHHTAPQVFHAPAPVYHAPAPVYHAPAPVYHAPAPVYHAPAPVYHAPAPVYHAPAPVQIYHAPAPHSNYGPPPAPRHHHVPSSSYGTPHHH